MKRYAKQKKTILLLIESHNVLDLLFITGIRHLSTDNTYGPVEKPKSNQLLN